MYRLPGSLETLRNCVIALSLASVFATASLADGLEPTPSRTRIWSNDQHYAPGLSMGSDCADIGLRYGADYVPGVDAWGRPVAPAEGPRTYGAGQTELDVEVHLQQMRIAGRDIDISANSSLPLPGSYSAAAPTTAQDCVPPFK